MGRMKIGSVAKLIAKCWTSAEKAVRDGIERKHYDLDEEHITTFFRGELREQCDKVSRNGEVEQAFKLDIQSALPTIPLQAVSDIGNGLIATVNFHPKEVEKNTGADFGLLFVRPDVSYSNWSDSNLVIDHDYGRGLLCQAKVLRRNSDWGELSPTQKENLQDRLKYLALVLYRYSDQDGARKKLEPFNWQLTCGISMDEIEGWLKGDSFPNLLQSEEILLGLALGQLGTDDKKSINDFIIPKVRQSLEIRIHRRDGRDPGRTLDLRQYTSSGKQHIHQGF
jgi:hypothetical protein